MNINMKMKKKKKMMKIMIMKIMKAMKKKIYFMINIMMMIIL